MIIAWLVRDQRHPHINYASGAYDVFGYQQTNGLTRSFLTEHHDPAGNVTRYAWTYYPFLMGGIVHACRGSPTWTAK